MIDPHLTRALMHEEGEEEENNTCIANIKGHWGGGSLIKVSPAPVPPKPQLKAREGRSPGAFRALVI